MHNWKSFRKFLFTPNHLIYKTNTRNIIVHTLERAFISTQSIIAFSTLDQITFSIKKFFLFNPEITYRYILRKMTTLQIADSIAIELRLFGLIGAFEYDNYRISFMASVSF